MPIRIFTIPFEADKAFFADDALARFLLNKQVKKMLPEFFQLNGQAYWTVFLEYESVGTLEETEKDSLDEGQRLLLKRLKEWRKEKAEKEGIPVFIIATNQQLMAVVKNRPVNLETLKDIHGFGKKKIERHGNEILHIVTSFYEKRSQHNRKPGKPSGSVAVRSPVRNKTSNEG